MKHYYHPMSRAVTTDWMLTELDAPHERIEIDVPGSQNDTPEYRAINPMGKIPTLVDSEVVVTETAAICAYLADRFPEKRLAPPVGSAERGSYYRYLFFAGVTLEPMFTVRSLGIENYPSQSVGWGDHDRCMTTVEALVPETGWAMRSGFTAADVVFGGTLDFAVQLGWMKSPPAKVAAYVQRIKQRPAYRQSHDPSWH